MSTQDKSQTTVGVSDGVLGPFTPLVENFAAYLIDAAQRSILFWDVMRQRSNHSRSVFGQKGGTAKLAYELQWRFGFRSPAAAAGILDL